MPFSVPVTAGTAARAEQAGDIMDAAGTVPADDMWARTGDMPAGRKSDPGGGARAVPHGPQPECQRALVWDTSGLRGLSLETFSQNRSVESTASEPWEEQGLGMFTMVSSL